MNFFSPYATSLISSISGTKEAATVMLNNSWNRLLYAAILGTILFTLGTTLGLYTNLEGLRLTMLYITPLVTGIVAANIKRGFILGFALSLIFLSISASLGLWPGVPLALTRNPSTVIAVTTLISINIAISGALGALGGFLGRQAVRK